MIGRALVVAAALALCGRWDIYVENRGGPHTREEIAKVRAARKAQDGVPVAEAPIASASSAPAPAGSSAQADAGVPLRAKGPVSCESVRRELWDAFAHRDEKVLAEATIEVERLCGQGSGVVSGGAAPLDSGVSLPD